MLFNVPTMLSGFAALTVVLGLIYVASRAAKFSGLATRLPRDAAGQLAVRDVLILDPRRRLHLIRCEGRTALLMTGGPQDIVVGWLPEEDRAA